ncbi:MAG: Site-specific recombinase XerD [Daejeonella sp.]|nr:Site-specific recombinase XerD [Daejeonella sp.]
MRSEREKEGRAPVMMGVTVNAEKTYISLKNYSVDVKHWDKRSGAGKRNTAEGRKINLFLDEFKNGITDCYRTLQSNGKSITLGSIKDAFLGHHDQEYTLTDLIKKHNIKAEAELEASTMKHYFVTQRYLYKFLKTNMNRSEILLKDINYEFISDFDTFLRNHEPIDHQRRINNNGVMKHMIRIRKMINYALKLDWISKDPFKLYDFNYDKVKKDYLTKYELADIMKKRFVSARLAMVRDLFVFSCYTGLAYTDMMGLKPDHIVIGQDGTEWIDTSRKKTNTPVNVPLLPEAKKIILIYNDHPRASAEKTLFPKISNQKYNSYLKEIADQSGIKKNLTSHVARHTFATTITLSNGVPIESVSKMLGHTKISTTQIYARVLNQKLSDDMGSLRKKLEKLAK